jgi:hypothetical protein
MIKKPNAGFVLGASPPCGDRAFLSNSSDLPMQILRGFRCNPERMGEQEFCESKIPTSPLRGDTNSDAYKRGQR